MKQQGLQTLDALKALRHSAAHTLAQAVKKLFPTAQVGVGPATEEGFYYDFRYERPFTPEDLERIEAEMKSAIRARFPIVRKPVSRSEATDLFQERGEPFKLELIQGIPDEAEITIYEQGEFVDLCRGPHVSSTGDIPAVKLLSTSSAYWKGIESNPSLQRIYGTAFENETDLENYLKQLEEIQKRDHRKLGKELDLFRTLDEKGAGLVLWLPRGSQVRRTLEDLWKTLHDQHGYRYVYTPHIARLDLWKQSGHWDYYRDSMFKPMETEGTAYELKPMNCPFHILVFKESVRSYRDLPVRFSELGTVYRYERSGTLHGLMRVRGFTQDDAHIFCKPEDLSGEILKVLALVDQMIGRFSFQDRTVYLSTRPEKSVGSDENWEMATNALKSALEEAGVPYEIDPGEGVFYGPKIDIKFHDAIGRAWQLSTIQVDFNLPEKFDLTYRNAKGESTRPIMIHRALFGSIERFFGILIEHYTGAFPLWLAPEQVRVMPLADRHIPYAEGLVESLKSQRVRVEGDFRNEKIGFKIREAQLWKIPEMWIVGDREVQENRVSIRTREGEKSDLLDRETAIQALLSRCRPAEWAGSPWP